MRQAGVGSDAARKPRRQTFHFRSEIARTVNAPHQASRLIDRRAAEAQRREIELAAPHGVEESGRPEMVRLAIDRHGD